jgi:hypothetical protein
MADAKPPPECANCGAAIPRAARACPECGADERTGWRENSLYDGLDLPDEAFAGDDPAAPSRRKTGRINGVSWYWWAAGALLLICLIIALPGLR